MNDLKRRLASLHERLPVKDTLSQMPYPRPVTVELAADTRSGGG
ncbi:hypothetical protein [Salinisphaera sp. T5B8]